MQEFRKTLMSMISAGRGPAVNAKGTDSFADVASKPHPVSSIHTTWHPRVDTAESRETYGSQEYHQKIFAEHIAKGLKVTGSTQKAWSLSLKRTSRCDMPKQLEVVSIPHQAFSVSRSSRGSQPPTGGFPARFVCGLTPPSPTTRLSWRL